MDRNTSEGAQPGICLRGLDRYGRAVNLTALMAIYRDMYLNNQDMVSENQGVNVHPTYDPQYRIRSSASRIRSVVSGSRMSLAR